MTTGFNISQQIEEVRYELMKREQVYPRLYSNGKLRRSEGEYHVARMNAVLKTLQWVEENVAQIRDWQRQKNLSSASPPQEEACSTQPS